MCSPAGMVPAQLTTGGQVPGDSYMSAVKSEAQHPYQTRVRRFFAWGWPSAVEWHSKLAEQKEARQTTRHG